MMRIVHRVHVQLDRPAPPSNPPQQPRPKPPSKPPGSPKPPNTGPKRCH